MAPDVVARTSSTMAAGNVGGVLRTTSRRSLPGNAKIVSHVSVLVYTVREMCDGERREEQIQKRKKGRRDMARGVSLCHTQRFATRARTQRARNAHSVHNDPPGTPRLRARGQRRRATRGAAARLRAPGGYIWYITVGHFKCIAWRLCPMG